MTTAAPASAMLLHLDAQATMTSGFFPFVTDYLPIGTVVDASVNFDVGPGTPLTLFATTFNSAGTFTWNDGTPRTFSVSSATENGLNSSGLASILFSGTGPTIGGSTATDFEIDFNIGVNPFTTSLALSDLLLSSTIDRIVVLVVNPNLGSSGVLDTNVSGSVRAAPEPATLALIGLGLAALGFSRRKQ